MQTKIITRRQSLYDPVYLCSGLLRKIFFPQFFFLLLFLSNFVSFSQSGSQLSFTAIPFSDPDIPSPFRGSNHWNRISGSGFSLSDNSVPLPHNQNPDIYIRFYWYQMETSAGVYNWTEFDRHVNAAILNKKKFSFGVMQSQLGSGPNVGGGSLSYPSYLHNQMQSEAANSQDWLYNSSWIPNFNSINYHTAWERLLRAIADHMSTTRYNGVLYNDAISYIDIRGYGDFGEWHNYPYSDVIPTGRIATVSSLKRIIDAHKNAFPNHPLVALIASFTNGGSSNTPPEVTHYMLTTSNNWGPFGWRWDSWGQTIYSDILESNRGSFNGVAFAPLIMERWKTSPVLGEPSSWAAGVSENGSRSMYYALEDQVRRYHASSIGNGNYDNVSVQSMRDNIIAASKASGYRIILEQGNLSGNLSAGQNMSITLNWKNIGIAPVYENWTVRFELQDQANNSVKWSDASSHQIKLWLPAANATVVTDNFRLPDNLAAGTYRLVVKIIDPSGYREPLPLAIQGRRSDGSYLLKSDVVINAAGANASPLSNAGSDQTVTLPTNSVTLNGSGTDADGTVTEFSWNKVSGPGGDVIQTVAAAVTLVTGLVAGTYVYRLTVKDDKGASATDDVQIIVNNPSPPPNSPPFANAGNDQSVTLPANTTTLNGSATDSDGTIASYAWSKISGPAGGNLQSANTASTNVTGLNAGTYLFRLTVTDNTGAIATDDIQVIVNTSLAPSPSNQAPTVNAGNDINITLPTNTATLTGTGTDADGSVSTYAWSKVSGPTGGNIQSNNIASTNITGLTTGTYIFRLTVTDNVGAEATDDVQVIVTAAPPVAGNQQPTANAGSNQSVTLPVNTVTLSGSGNDADGSITAFSWTKISGPSGGNIQAPSAASTVIVGLVEGTYTYRLTVTDNAGATATGDVQIIVNAAPVVPNTAPTANAGHNISITLPTNSVTLNGTASVDPDGSIVTYSWRKVQGPAGSSFASTNIASPSVNGLARGQHEFELTITDNRGASSTDRVLVTVIKINQKPVAKLIRDTIAVVLPVQNAELSAIESYDPDGVVTNYEWTYKKGPKDPKMLSPQSSKTVIADLVSGTYEFDLVVTDDDGDIDKKAVVVIVKNNSSRRLIPDISVYPNPATNLVNIKISSEVDGRTTLTFIDMNGRPVMTDVFVKGYGSYTRQVNIGRLPKGTYTILIQVDQTEKVVEKLIKF